MIKVPVFLGSTMELIAIVRIDDHILNNNIARHGGYIRFCEYPSMRAVSTGVGAMQETIRYMDFKGYPIHSNTAQSFYLLVDRHDDLRFFKGMQIWPRSRPDRSKRSKAERKYRREQGYTRPQHRRPA